MTKQSKHLENLLHQTEARFRALIENSCEGITVVDAEAKILYVSPADERILGRRPEDCIGAIGFTWVHPDDTPRLRSMFAQVLQHPGQTYRAELRARHKDGSWRWIEAAARNLLDNPSVQGVVINYHDITPRKQQEEEARQQRERFEVLSRATRDVVWDWNIETNELWWNTQFYQRFGYPISEAPTIEFWAAKIDPAFKPAVMKSLETVFQSTENHWSFEYPFRNFEGNYLQALDRGYVIRNQEGKPIRMLGTLMDISARKNAEINMQKLAAFARFNPNPVFEFSDSGKLTYFNEASASLARSVGKDHPGAILPPELSGWINQCLQTGEPILEQRNTICCRTISWSLFPVPTCNVVHCFAADITDRIHLENQLRHASKMEAIGQLAGGVAHDFNNLLTVIEGHATLLGFDQNIKGKTAESINEISRAAERAANLTRQLLTFSRKQVMQPQSLDCHDVVNNITRMLQRLLGEDIRLQVHYAPSLPTVFADPGMLEQVLVNLAINARDAMPGGGQLQIETSSRLIDADLAAANPEASPGHVICISVTDTGCGISAEMLPRIFEPFFTTKEVGKGTGLGLATAYGIIKQHKGWITVSSQLGRGSTFTIFLPASGVAGVEAAKPAEPIAGYGHETILLVEDEAPVRQLTRSVLELFGYKVIEAPTGKEAWNLWQQHRNNIDLVLTDMVMPDGMSGRELVQKIREDKNEAKAIYISGYSADFCARDTALKEGFNFLQKPYDPIELSETIRRCLDNPIPETFSSN